jgi:hypothetical protein
VWKLGKRKSIRSKAKERGWCSSCRHRHLQQQREGFLRVEENNSEFVHLLSYECLCVNVPDQAELGEREGGLFKAKESNTQEQRHQNMKLLTVHKVDKLLTAVIDNI